MRAARYWCDDCGVCAAACDTCPPYRFATERPLTAAEQRRIEAALTRPVLNGASDV